MNDRYVLPLGAIGTGKFSWSLKGGYRIKSIAIANPSGSWLLIVEDDTLIAPFTIGVIHNFAQSLTQVSVKFVAGPAQKISIQQGDNPTLVINSEAAAEFVGTPFVPTSHLRQVAGTIPVAASLTNVAFTLADLGRHIYGIQIDNKSGLWLQLGTYLDVIPPYTVGWTKTLADGPTAVTVTQLANGPDGSNSVAVGDPPILTIADDLNFGNQAGNPFTVIAHKESTTTVAFANLGVISFAIAANVGRLIAGVIIDNPSGSWLSLIIGGATYLIPPYTLRWNKAIIPPVLSTTSLSFVAGPSSQVSTKQGDQVTLTILDVTPDKSDVSFITNFTPILSASATAVTALLNGTSTVLIAAVANKRIRMLSYEIHALSGAAFSIFAPQSGVDFGFLSSITSVGFLGHIYPPKLFAASPFVLDFPVGEGVIFSATADWANVMLDANMTYQVI